MAVYDQLAAAMRDSDALATVRRKPATRANLQKQAELAQRCAIWRFLGVLDLER